MRKFLTSSAGRRGASFAASALVIGSAAVVLSQTASATSQPDPISEPIATGAASESSRHQTPEAFSGRGDHPTGGELSLQPAGLWGPEWTEIQRSALSHEGTARSQMYTTDSGALALMHVQAGGFRFVDRPSETIAPGVQGWITDNPNIDDDRHLIVAGADTFTTVRFVGLDDSAVRAAAADLFSAGPTLADRLDNGQLGEGSLPQAFGPFSAMNPTDWDGLGYSTDQTDFQHRDGAVVTVVRYGPDDTVRADALLRLEGATPDGVGVYRLAGSDQQPSLIARQVAGGETVVLSSWDRGLDALEELLNAW